MAGCFLYNFCNHKDCENSFCIRKYKLESLYNESLLSESQRVRLALKIDNDGTDFEEFNKLAEIERNIEDFVTSGQNLYIHSTNCGNGKSSWAIRLIQSYFNAIWPKTELTCKALFISVPRFLLAMKDKIESKNEYFEFIKDNIDKADLVVWDDIATKPSSQYELDRLLGMLEARNGKANIFTSNANMQEIYDALGERAASRICNTSIDICLHGADKRFLKVGGDK